MKKNKKNFDAENENNNGVFDFGKMKGIFQKTLTLYEMQKILEKLTELSVQEGNLRATAQIIDLYKFFSQAGTSLEQNDRRDEWCDVVQSLVFPPTDVEAQITLCKN